MTSYLFMMRLVMAEDSSEFCITFRNINLKKLMKLFDIYKTSLMNGVWLI